jgi:hypothetical protein
VGAAFRTGEGVPLQGVAWGKVVVVRVAGAQVSPPSVLTRSWPLLAAASPRVPDGLNAMSLIDWPGEPPLGDAVLEDLAGRRAVDERARVDLVDGGDVAAGAGRDRRPDARRGGGGDGGEGAGGDERQADERVLDLHAARAYGAARRLLGRPSTDRARSLLFAR